MSASSAVNPLARRVVQELAARGQTVATCESLTAGLAAATLAEVPGASAVLRGGLITYATELKTQLAGVPAELIAQHGVVSAPVAQAMAQGARTRCGATWALALTGVAGPERQDGHPVGEVFIGLAGPDGQRAVRADNAGGRFALAPGQPHPVRVLVGSRAQIRRQAVDCALLTLADALSSPT